MDNSLKSLRKAVPNQNGGGQFLEQIVCPPPPKDSKHTHTSPFLKNQARGIKFESPKYPMAQTQGLRKDLIKCSPLPTEFNRKLYKAYLQFWLWIAVSTPLVANSHRACEDWWTKPFLPSELLYIRYFILLCTGKWWWPALSADPFLLLAWVPEQGEQFAFSGGVTQLVSLHSLSGYT